MRNVGGALAQRKFTRALLSTLAIAGVEYHWQHSKTRKWIMGTEDDSEIELALRGMHWQADKGNRTLIYNLTVPIIKNNVDMCLFSLAPEEVESAQYNDPQSYMALGELKGGIDPAGADEHWKTARAALDRIREAFSRAGASPGIFFIGAAIEKKMAGEIWDQLENQTLSNAANLNQEHQVAALARWLWRL
jgi:hypothetical protein